MKRIDKLKTLAIKFDNDHLLSLDERIMLYVNMSAYDEIKSYAEKPLTDIKIMLAETRNYESLRVMKNAYYSIGQEFHYDQPIFIDHKTVYNDKQNVHTLVNDTTRVALKIIRDYSSLYYRPAEFSANEFAHFFYTIESTPTSEFCPKSLFASVYKCIMSTNSVNKKLNMLNRLKEELKESDGMCFSGCIVRLINALRGFGFDSYETKLDAYEYERSKAYYCITKIIDSEHIDITIPNELVKRVKNIVNDNTVQLSKTYGCRILESYTGLKWLRINDKYYVDIE